VVCLDPASDGARDGGGMGSGDAGASMAQGDMEVTEDREVVK